MYFVTYEKGSNQLNRMTNSLITRSLHYCEIRQLENAECNNVIFL